MGRVRRYKKIKAIDPFAKKGKAEVDTVHDEPPDIFNNKKVKKRSRLESFMDDSEVLIQREGQRLLRDASEQNHRQNERKIEPKKDEESMKQFKKRIRQETRIALRDELQAMTATSKKRKIRLKERKQKRQDKNRSQDEFKEEILDFSMSEDGRIRPSDRGETSDFQRRDVVKFGEVSHMPPDLTKIKFKMEAKKIKFTNNNNNSKIHPTHNQSSNHNISSGDPGDQIGTLRNTQKIGIIHHGGGTKASVTEIEAMRLRVQEAYKALKEKRKAIATGNQSGVNHTRKNHVL